ncbi:MAG: TldD/PmbA family protein [Oligoflexia bacterium]|nr:TldD/PmbA family protein [Oligoflexia bacterium]
MEKLLEMAKRVADQAEIYSIATSSNDLSFENYELNEIKNSMQSGYALRIIKNGYIGISYTKNLLDRNQLIENALTSLRGKIAAQFSFSKKGHPKIFNDLYDKSIENIKIETAVEEFKQISSYVKKNLKSEGTLNISSSYGDRKIRLMNSNGVDYSHQSSFYENYSFILFPKSYSHIHTLLLDLKYKPFALDKIQEMIDFYHKAYPEVKVAPGSYPTIFAPSALYSLMWRFNLATNAKSLYEKVSPLENKISEQIFSDKLTIIDDPHIPDECDSRGFDDEGVETSKLTLIDKGVFKSFYNNLEYAAKTDSKPTGHGYKGSMMGGEETVSLKISPSLTNITIAPGDHSFEEMIKKIDKGVVVLGVLGAHSGNLLNGDFSVGLVPGLYVENGEIVGRIKDGMIAGNIYQVMKNVSMVENKVHRAPLGRYPSICFDQVKLSVKS